MCDWTGCEWVGELVDGNGGAESDVCDGEEEGGLFKLELLDGWKYCDIICVFIPSSSSLSRSERKEIVSSCFFKELS